MPKVYDVKLNELAGRLSADGTLSEIDVNALIDQAMADGALSSAGRNELKILLCRYADQLESPAARDRLQGFIGIVDKSIRELAYRTEKDKGVIDVAEAEALLALARNNPRISKRETLSLQGVMIAMHLTPAARAELERGLAKTGAPSLDLKLPPILGRTYVLSTEGHFSTGSGAAPRYDENGALTVYRAAAALARAPADVLKDVPTAVKEKLSAHLQRALAAGEDAGPLPQLWKQRLRAGAATTLLALIEGCGADDTAVRAQALDLYFAAADREPDGGLRASMFFNLERLEASLTPADQARLQALGNLVIPTRPPYDKWLADGKREIHVKHYAHADCWANNAEPVAAYRARGFQVVEDHSAETPKRWILEGTNAAAPGGPIKVKVDLVQSHDGIFQSMSDPDNQVILYTGHSNLGGNVSEELRLGPQEKGAKLILLAMCRGKQNMFEVANKYSASHFITTNHPSYFTSMMPMTMGVIDGIMNQWDYDTMRAHIPAIWDTDQIDNYFFPNQRRRYALYDLDRDGVVDGRGPGVDRIYNVGLKVPAGAKADGVPRANDYAPEDLDGSKVLHAVQFLNTLMTYHVEHGPGSSAFGAADADAFLSGGWFAGRDTELVRLTKETVGDRDLVRVQVNKALADQTWPVLGAIVQCEVAKLLAKERRGGALSREDLGRALLFAGEYLSYMYCSAEEAEAAVRAIGRDAGLPKLSFAKLAEAIDTDGHGYATDQQLQALLARLQ